MRIINLKHWRFWSWYFSFSDKNFHYMRKFNEILINTKNYDNCSDEHYELAMLVKFSGQV